MTIAGPEPAGGAGIAELRWIAERGALGVRERGFELEHHGRTVPGILWTPDEQVGAPWPLVLIGHGGSGSKREDYVVAIAHRLVRRHRLAAAAIDGPVHGDRRTDPSSAPFLVMAEFAQQWSANGDAMTDAMVTDWRATLDALVTLRDVADGPIGWWGLSMGTILGLPVVAAEPRIAVAVLGLMGLTGPTRARIERDAPAVHCPVLFLAQWHDELFPIADALALFEALGSTDKRLHAHPGGHGALPGEEFTGSADFLAGRLRGYVAGD
jgi:fermentation-respiration switch protein FrsA (DUF1100 family)